MSKAWSHERQAGKEEWLTPPAIVEALGPFDLDPCAPEARPWDTAARHFTRADDGLIQPWTGRVWLNPPYGTKTGSWLKKLAHHGDGIALVFARTDTAMFHDWVFGWASAVLFLRGRLRFYRLDGSQGGSAGAASCLVAYGDDNLNRIGAAGIDGYLVEC